MEQFHKNAPTEINRETTQEVKESLFEKTALKLVNLAKACGVLSYYIEKNPDFDYDTLVTERLQRVMDEYHIGHEVASAIEDRIGKIVRTRDTIARAIHQAQKNDTNKEGWQIKLFQRMFHFTPEDTIGVTHVATHITFAVNSYKDYVKMFGQWENPAHPSAGRAAATNNIPYTVLRIDKEMRGYRDSVDIHENQHIANNIIFGQSEIKAKKKNLDSPDTNDAPVDNDTVFQTLVEDFEIGFAPRIKDEILAYLKGGTQRKEINQYLTSSELYDYLKITGGKNHLVRRIQNNKLLKNEDGSYMTDPSVIGEFVEKAYAQSRKVATEWLQTADTIDSLLDQQIKNDFYINLLAVTPIHRWKTLEKLLWGMKKQTTNVAEISPTKSENINDEAMAAYIKYEDYESGMDSKLYHVKR